MRRNALKNRKLSQTKKWRREKHRRPGKRPLKSSTVKRHWTFPLSFQGTLRDLTIRVRRHSVEFLINCKDPKSKERALLQQLEEVKPNPNRPNQAILAGEENNDGKVNLKPFTPDSSMSLEQQSRPALNSAGLNSKSVKVMDRRAVHTRTSSRTRSSVYPTLTPSKQTRSSNTTSAATVCIPVEIDKIVSAINREKNEESATESQDNSSSDMAQHRPAEQTEQTRSSSRLTKSACQSATDGSKKTGDSSSSLIPLKQYLTVNLTRLSLPQSVEAEKTPGDGEVRGKVRRRSRKSQCPRSAALTVQLKKNQSRSQPGQRGGSGICTVKGNKGVREMFFKAVGKVNARKPRTGGSAGNSSQTEKKGPNKVIKMQKGRRQKVQQVTVKDKTEEQEEEERNAVPAHMGVKNNISLEDVKETECTILCDGKMSGQCSMRDVKTSTSAWEADGAVELSAQVEKSGSTHPGSQHEDVVIKKAQVLLSDILRKDKSIVDKRLQGDIVGRGVSSVASEEMHGATVEAELTDVNGGRQHHSVRRRIMRRRKMRRRTVKRKAVEKQSNKVSKHVPAVGTTELSEGSLPKLSQTHDPLTTTLGTLPQKPAVAEKATTNVHPDTTSQAHIPLKKRMFRNSVEINPEQGLHLASDQTSNGANLNPSTAPRQDLIQCTEEDNKGKRETKVRHRRTELQRLTCRRTPKQISFKRVLRSKANEAQRAHVLRKVQKDELDSQGEHDTLKSDEPADGEQSEDSAAVPHLSVENPNNSQRNDDVEMSDLEIKPGLNFKIRFKRQRGKVWEMQSAAFEEMPFTVEKREELESCDPFKAIMDSVSILNMEMEAAQAHVLASKSKKSKRKLHHLRKRGERLSEAQAQTLSSDQGHRNVEDKCEISEPKTNQEETKYKLDKELEVKYLPGKVKSQKNNGDSLPVANQETKIEDRFLWSCCQFEGGSQQKRQLDLNGLPLPVIKLRRKAEDIWEVDDKEKLQQADFKIEPKVKKEAKGIILGKQKKGHLDLCPAVAKSEPPPFSLSLSPLSLSSPLNDSKPEGLPLGVGRIPEMPEINSGVRKQRHKMERARKFGPVETPTTCLSHTLQQIDNSLSRLSEGLCSSQTLERPTACSSATNSVIQPPSQSPPFTAADNMLSTEPNFTNCCDDILDFQCLNFEGYYQPQNILPSSPSDLCSLEPPTDPFSSPLSHSPSDTWTAETPYIGPPSPGDNFTSEDLQFFPGFISSKNDSVPLQCEEKDTSKDRISHNPNYNCSAYGNSDLTPRDRIIGKNPAMRLSKEDPKTQSLPVVGKPRLFGAAPAFTSQSQYPVSLTQPSNIKPTTSQSKSHFNLKTQGPFHRMSVPNKPQTFPGGQLNTVRGVSQSCSTKSTPSSQMPSKFLSPPLFTVKNPNPPDNPFNFHEKNSSVIHRVLKFQGGNQSQNLYSAPCKASIDADSPSVMSRTFGSKLGVHEKIQQSQNLSTDGQNKDNISGQGFAKDVGYLGSSSNPSRSNLHFTKPNSSFSHPFSKSNVVSNKLENEPNMTYRNFSTLPRTFFFPSKVSEGYSSSPDKRQDRSTPSTPNKSQQCYAQQDHFDFSFGSSLSPMTQNNSPHVVHSTPPATPAPANRSQSSTSSASIPYGYQGPPYVLNFTGDHSLTLGLRDGVEVCPGLGSANYTYHCLMEPSGTQGRLVLEPCGPQLSNPASFSLGGFSGLKSQDENCRKDVQQQCHPGQHQEVPQYGSVNAGHSMGATKPKRVRLVVTDGTVDLDLQYSD